MPRLSGNANVSTIKERIRESLGVKIEIYDESGEVVDESDSFSNYRDENPESIRWGEEVSSAMHIENVEKEFEEKFGVKIKVKKPEGEPDPSDTLKEVRRAWERNDELPPLASWLNEKMEEKNYSVEELADEVDVSKQTIINLRTGKTKNPISSTRRRIEAAIGEEIKKETKEDIDYDARVKGIGSLKDIPDPFEIEGVESVSGVYVIYDVNDRPLYVGKGVNIKSRIRDHISRKWYARKIVGAVSYLEVEEEDLRDKIESVLISFMKSNSVVNKQKTEG